MKILGIGSRVPSKVESNEDRLEMLRAANADKDPKFIRRASRTAKALLVLSGGRDRRVLDPSKGESAFTLGVEAANEAIERAGIDRSSIELIIHAAVSRAFLEPSMGYVWGEALGIDHAHGFDMSDACMSWFRAMYVAQGLLHSGQYKRILIMTTEFNSNLHNLELDELKDLEYTIPQLTIGEAATATIVDGSGDPWPFWFMSSGGGNDLCKLPLPGSERWRAPGKELLTPYRFYCHFGPMNAYTLANFKGKFESFFYGLREEGRRFDHAFTHSSELTSWKRWSQEYDLKEQFYSIYPRYGNVVSASVPLAISEKLAEGKLKEGDGCFVYMASSGMSVGCSHFYL